MSPQPNHYEALGLPPTASAEQIKRKYRELARLYHPDVNPSPEAAQKILTVNQAYRTLGDPDRRAVYDAERVLRQPSPRPRPQQSPGNAAPRARRPAAPPPKARTNVFYDGFGRNFTEAKPERPSPGPAPASGRQRHMPDSQNRSLEHILTEAKLAFINRQFPLAQRLCQEALKINPKDAVAHEILGDVYMRQGDTQRAGTAFGYAIQFNPRNQTAQAKLNRLMRAVQVQANGPSILYTRADIYARPPGATPEIGLAIVGMIAGALLITAPFALALGASAEGLGTLLGVSLNLVAALCVAGFAAGILLAFYARMRPFTDEVWTRTRDDGSQSPVPLGVVLGVFAILFFYGSFLIYIGMSATRNRFSPSILRAYAATLAMVLVFSLVYHPTAIGSAPWVATVWGGNLLFPSVLFGWLFGDALRLRGRL